MTSSRPLAGITILEIGHSIAAPFAGMILGELGADVVKLENPKTGDYARDWGPPFAGGASTCFQAVNRAKRGITVDFTSAAEVERLKRFIRDEVDVVFHNLKFGALDKYGLPASSSPPRSRASSIAISAPSAPKGHCASGLATTR
jgi:crotonobetainyl-CoA:carnitine CoA-transferase CaiB-like acyl-CoA transferase